MSQSQLKNKEPASNNTRIPSPSKSACLPQPADTVLEESVYISPEEFRELATSHRALARIDSTPPGVKGLVDRVTRVRYLVEEARLAQLFAG
jgi:hypothetical protein